MSHDCFFKPKTKYTPQNALTTHPIYISGSRKDIHLSFSWHDRYSYAFVQGITTITVVRATLIEKSNPWPLRNQSPNNQKSLYPRVF